MQREELPNLRIADSPIPFCDEVRNLGLIIDQNLSWASHVNKITKSVNQSLYPLLKFKYVIPTSLKAQLVSTLILPLFDYSDIAYQDLSQELSLKLQRSMNRCIRFIFNLQLSDHITEYINKLSWLKLESRRRLHTLSLLYQILNTKTPRYLSCEFRSLDTVHMTNTRGNHNLVIPHHRTVIYNKSFTVTACREWNNLNLSTRNSLSLASFKRRLHKELFNSQLAD